MFFHSLGQKVSLVFFFFLHLLECEQIHGIFWGVDPTQTRAINPVWAPVFARDSLLLLSQYPRG